MGQGIAKQIMAANKLTALEFKNLKASDKEQLVSDGDNLYVSIRAQSNGGSKSFRMTYRIAGKKQWITLKEKTLSKARAERLHPHQHLRPYRLRPVH